MNKEAELQKLLDRITKDSRKAHDLAQQLYGPDAWVFAESDGTIHAMAGDHHGNGMHKRQAFIRLTAKGIHQLGVGAW